MQIHERLKYLRKDVLNITQEQFAEKIGLSRSNLGSIEIGRISLTERNVDVICSLFDVSKDWLINGSGEVFTRNDEGAFSRFVELHDLTAADAAILRVFVGLSPASRATFCDVIRHMAEALPAAPVETEYERATRIVHEKLAEANAASAEAVKKSPCTK